MKKLRIIILVAACVLMAGKIDAATVTLTPTLDTVVTSDDPTTSYGNYTLLVVGRDYFGVDILYRSFLKFDLSTIPDGSIITSAELNLYCDYHAGSVTSYEAYHVASDASIQNSMTWNTQPSTGFTHLDIVPVMSGWRTWDLLDSGSWNYSNDLTDNLLSVRLIRFDEPGNYTAYAVFHSLENSVGDAFDPYLDIEYNVIPIPSSIFLLASSLFGILGFRRQFRKK